MKILINPKQLEAAYKQASRPANKGCHVCPNCGEYRETWQAMGNGNPYYQEGLRLQAIRNGYIEINAKGIEIKEQYSQKEYKDLIVHTWCRTYHCYSCGCKWRGEPFSVFQDAYGDCVSDQYFLAKLKKVVDDNSVLLNECQSQLIKKVEKNKQAPYGDTEETYNYVSEGYDDYDDFDDWDD